MTTAYTNDAPVPVAHYSAPLNFDGWIAAQLDGFLPDTFDDLPRYPIKAFIKEDSA